jgi:replicative DNA helicase
VVLALKGLAGELGIPLLLLSQINREIGEHERPALGNLRDTGASEEHASNVIFVHQQAKPSTDYDEWEEIEVIIAKQRNGPARLRVPMEFKKQWGLFRCAVPF